MDGVGTMVVRLHTLLIFTAIACYAWAAQAADIAVDQRNKQFTPEDIVLRPGDTLIFTNHDTVTHNIHVIDVNGDAQDKGLQKPGEIIRQAFTEPGVYQVRCHIHPDMILMVTVK